ncbi:MAG: tetratricopeptide repeat protein, partial [Aestuariivirgaceae bacterium]
TNADPNLRNAARIRAAFLLIDTAPREEIVRRIGDLNTPDNVWRNEAREILALAAYRAKDFNETDRLMNDVLLDQETPQNQRQRAQIMISLLAPHLDAKKPAAQ